MKQGLTRGCRGSFALITLSMLACSSSSKPPVQTPEPPSVVGGLKVSVVSVTLANDCSMPEPAAAAVQPAPAWSQPPPMGDSEYEAPSTGASMSRSSSYRRSCVQTSVQLYVEAPSDKGGRLSIKRAELVDASGKVLGELVAHHPTHYGDDAYYVEWDQQVAPGTNKNVAWALTSPQWSDYGLSAESAAGSTYRVRVTVSVDDANGGQAAEQVLTGDATMDVESPETPLEPGVVT